MSLEIYIDPPKEKAATEWIEKLRALLPEEEISVFPTPEEITNCQPDFEGMFPPDNGAGIKPPDIRTVLPQEARKTKMWIGGKTGRIITLQLTPKLKGSTDFTHGFGSGAKATSSLPQRILDHTAIIVGMTGNKPRATHEMIANAIKRERTRREVVDTSP